MVRMKVFLTSIFFTALLVSNGDSRVEIDEGGYFCRQIEMSLAEEFLKAKKPLPSSFEEMELLREIVARDPEDSRSINGMVIVPEAPKISSQRGISRTRSDRRLFAISRTAGERKAAPNELGRYSVWISRDGTYATPEWIPESEVQLIMNQLEDFSPESQPMAFVDAEEDIREKKDRDEIIQQQMREAYERQTKRFPKDRSSNCTVTVFA